MKHYFKICWIAIILLSACTLNTSTTNSNSGSLTIRSAAGEELAVIQMGDGEISVRDQEGQLTGIAKRSDKRKYYNGSNTMVYAVKLDDDGFKLRDGNEQMIWKIKLYPDKLKIANNEEMTGAYEVKLKEDGKLKLERNDSEVKAIHLSAAADWSEIDQQYSIQGFGRSLAPGILLIPEIQEREKFIIMAEIVQRGR
ncbi:MAG: hypothetical protein JNM57_01465 [Cyclobacteriaceae bacterium]|nr:hypothetical protein [Cyclobacteriaceae bacterium]